MSLPPTKSGHIQTRKSAEELAARYPALLSEARRISANVIHGAHGRRKRGMGETFWEFRHARHEDSAQDIDWRRSGRSDELFVRETEWEAANTILFWRDAGTGMNWHSHKSLPSKQDRASVLLAALAIALLYGGERCAAPGISDRPGGGAAAIERVSRDLIAGETSFEAVLQQTPSRHASMVLASDFLEEPAIWEKRFAALAALGMPVTLLHIADPEEEDFPYDTHSLFRDPASASRIDLGRPQMVREQYRQLFQAGRDRIAMMARKHGWLFIAHRTDHTTAEAFLALYQGIGGGQTR